MPNAKLHNEFMHEKTPKGLLILPGPEELQIWGAECEHTPNLPHTSEWEDNRCHICNEIFKETLDFKTHMVNEHSFKEYINVCYRCDEYTDVGRGCLHPDN